MKRGLSFVVAAILFSGLACNRAPGPNRQEDGPDWRQIPVRESKPDELGKDAGRVRNAVLECITPLQQERLRVFRRLREEPRYDLDDLDFFPGRIGDEQFVLAVATFIEKGVAHASEVDVQVRAVLWRGRISILQVSQGTNGLDSRNPVELWRLGQGDCVRILIRDLQNCGCQTYATGVTVLDYELGSGDLVRRAGIGASEHHWTVSLLTEVDTSSGEMVLTATHPNDGKDPLADVEAESGNPEVKIEQLRRTCVRVTLPNPS